MVSALWDPLSTKRYYSNSKCDFLDLTDFAPCAAETVISVTFEAIRGNASRKCGCSLTFLMIP